MKAVVDKDLCIGCGLCPEMCPEVFEMADDDKAHVKVDPVPPASEGSCREAAEECPVSAITVEDS
jgi:ferredoxin